jgi:hypothetical protein
MFHRDSFALTESLRTRLNQAMNLMWFSNQPNLKNTLLVTRKQASWYALCVRANRDKDQT